MSAVVPQNKNAHSDWFDSEQQVISKDAKACPTNVISEETEMRRISRNSCNSSLHFIEKTIAQFRATFAIEILQRLPYIGLNGSMKT